MLFEYLDLASSSFGHMAGFCKNADKLHGSSREFLDWRSGFQTEQARSCTRKERAGSLGSWVVIYRDRNVARRGLKCSQDQES